MFRTTSPWSCNMPSRRMHCCPADSCSLLFQQVALGIGSWIITKSQYDFAFQAGKHSKPLQEALLAQWVLQLQKNTQERVSKVTIATKSWGGAHQSQWYLSLSVVSPSIPLMETPGDVPKKGLRYPKIVKSSRRPSEAPVLSSDGEVHLSRFWKSCSERNPPGGRYFLTRDLQGSQISRGASCGQATFKPEMFAQLLRLRQIKILLRSASCTCKETQIRATQCWKKRDTSSSSSSSLTVACCPGNQLTPYQLSMSRLLMGHIWMTRWLWGAKGMKAAENL